MVDLRVNLCGLELDNPVVPASGTFGFGKEFSEFYDINMLGSFSFKGTTRDARFGNLTPRIAEVHRRHDQCRWSAKSRGAPCDPA